MLYEVRIVYRIASSLRRHNARRGISTTRDHSSSRCVARLLAFSEVLQSAAWGLSPSFRGLGGSCETSARPSTLP